MGLAQCLQADLVLPLAPIMRKNRNQAAAEIDALLGEKACEILVVGLPQNEENIRRIKHFIGLLTHPCEVHFVSEELSSKEAKEQGAKEDKSGRIDSASAAIILKRFLRKKPLQG
ncbi:MAG: Holliday junction resolvase RuvX [Deltaproteobacteria bacterium]|nr:MAG: Holliday junction resolvase RuvX [Deltaproteobacteria bacterium]